MTVTLKPVTEEQKRYVAPNRYSIAQEQFYPGTQMRAIDVGETLTRQKC